MAETKYKPILHDHDAFLRKASKRRGFQIAYQALAVEYAVANEMLAARARAGLYTKEWGNYIREKYGAPPSVTYFDSPVIVDNVTNQIVSDS